MIYFRTDANDQIGIGHMMRCFSIAKALRRMGEEPTFFVADRISAKMVAEAGYGYVCLFSDYDHLNQEADKILQRMRERCVEKLVVDSYFVTQEYLTKIRAISKLAYIDDINKFIYPCDLLIDYNIYSGDLHYEERYRSAGLNTKFALGLSYMPLREDYMNIVREDHDGFRILMTTGATDRFDVLGHLLHAMQAHLNTGAAVEVYAVIGRYNHNREQLLQEFRADPRIHLLDPQPDLVKLISNCDMAVTAGGTTVYELCAGGLPSVMLTIADNQKRAAQEFERRGLIPYAGDVRTDMEGVCRRVLQQIDRNMADPQMLAVQSRKLRKVIDGRGAQRIAQALIDM